MTHTVITSFTEDGYELYGREFIRTFRQHWPESVRLVVYYEGDDTFRKLNGWEDYWRVEHVKDWFDMLTFDIQRGILPGGKYNINLDAGMARKVFMQAHAVQEFGGKVFWVDADSVTHAPVPANFLDEMLPDDKFCCYLGRHTKDGTPWYYTESGFLGYNANHPLCEQFMKAYKAFFLFGVVFTHPRWHDCEGFDAMRVASNRPDAFVNLSEGLPDGTMHPLINSRIGEILDHRKGPRKHSRSGGNDLVVERTEPYWKEQEHAMQR